MKKLSKQILQQARKQFAALGYKAMAKKYTDKQKQAWRKKGGETTKKKILAARKNGKKGGRPTNL